MSVPKKRAEPLIISDFGILYRFSRRNWKRYCEDWVRTSGKIRILDYATHRIGDLDHVITDWKAQDFREHLEMEEETQ